MFNLVPQNIELDVLLATYEFIKTKTKPAPVLEAKMMAFVDDLKFMAVYHATTQAIFHKMEQSFVMMKEYYLAQNPQPIPQQMVMPEDSSNPALNADLLAAEFYVALANYVLENIEESKNAGFIKFLLYQNAVPNLMKAAIVNKQSIEKQKLLLTWIFESGVLQYYLTTIYMVHNGQPASMLYLTDFFVYLNKKPELAEFVTRAAQIIGARGSQLDQKIFTEYYPDVQIPTISSKFSRT